MSKWHLPKSQVGALRLAVVCFADFRSVQNRHEKARRQLHSTDIGSMSSIHFSSPSQTYLGSAPGIATGAGSILGGISGGPKSSTMKKKTTSRQTSVETAPAPAPAPTSTSTSTSGRLSNMSPLNPRRGGGNGAGLVSLGGAVASMNPNAPQGLGTRATSPTAGRKRILGGLRKSGGSRD